MFSQSEFFFFSSIAFETFAFQFAHVQCVIDSTVILRPNQRNSLHRTFLQKYPISNMATPRKSPRLSASNLEPQLPNNGLSDASVTTSPSLNDCGSPNVNTGNGTGNHLPEAKDPSTKTVSSTADVTSGDSTSPVTDGEPQPRKLPSPPGEPSNHPIHVATGEPQDAQQDQSEKDYSDHDKRAHQKRDRVEEADTGKNGGDDVSGEEQGEVNPSTKRAREDDGISTCINKTDAKSISAEEQVMVASEA